MVTTISKTSRVPLMVARMMALRRMGDAVRDAGYLHTERFHQLVDVEGGGFAFGIGVEGQDDFGNLFVFAGYPRDQLFHTDFVGADAVEGRNDAAKHVVASLEFVGLFDHIHIPRLLDHADGAVAAFF